MHIYLCSSFYVSIILDSFSFLFKTSKGNLFFLFHSLKQKFIEILFATITYLIYILRFIISRFSQILITIKMAGNFDFLSLYLKWWNWCPGWFSKLFWFSKKSLALPKKWDRWLLPDMSWAYPFEKGAFMSRSFSS